MPTPTTFTYTAAATNLAPSSGGTAALSGVFVSFNVPAAAVSGTTWARFRISSAVTFDPSREALDGEVEDYLVTIQPNPGTITGKVYDDLNNNGMHDAGEPVLSGWTVTATPVAGPPIAVTTLADGSYTLKVPAGTSYGPGDSSSRLDRDGPRRLLQHQRGAQPVGQRRRL